MRPLLRLLPVLIAHLTLATTAHALTFLELELTCPVGGEKFRQRMATSGTQFGTMLDLKPFGPIAAPWTLGECPGNGFVMYKHNFTAEELERLTPYVASPAYQALRGETSYYRAAQLQRQLGTKPDVLASTLLEASWQASEAAQYRRYATEMLGTVETLLAAPPPNENAFTVLQAVAGELERRLGRFEAAQQRFEKVRPLPAFQPAHLSSVVEMQLRLIAARDSAPHEMPQVEKPQPAPPQPKEIAPK